MSFPPAPWLSRLPYSTVKSQTDLLELELKVFTAAQIPSSPEIDMRNIVIQCLTSILKFGFQDLQVITGGSTMSWLCAPTDVIDLVLKSPVFQNYHSTGNFKKELLLVQRLLENSDFVDSDYTLHEDRLTFSTSPIYGIFTINLSFSLDDIEGSKEIYRILKNFEEEQVGEKFRMLIFFFKRLLRNGNIELNGYEISLLVIHYCTRAASSSLTSSLINFLSYYSHQFNYQLDLISFPSRLTVSKTKFPTLNPSEELTIQNPISLDPNLIPHFKNTSELKSILDSTLSHFNQQLSQEFDPTFRKSLFPSLLLITSAEKSLRQFNKDLWRNKSLQDLVEIGLPITVESERFNIEDFRKEYEGMVRREETILKRIENYFENWREWKFGRLWYAN